MMKNLGHWSQIGCLLALILLIGGEYKITHTCGRVSYCKVKAITLDGDYVIQHPKKIVGYNGSGHIPIIVWKKEEVTLSFLRTRILRAAGLDSRFRKGGRLKVPLQSLLLGLILQIGGEYRITDTEGKVNFYLIKEALPNGDYVGYSPARWLGIRGKGMDIRPSFEYRQDDRWKIVLNPSKIAEAELIGTRLIQREGQNAK